MNSKCTTTFLLLREALYGVKAIADREAADGHPVPSFDPEVVIYGLKLLGVPYDSRSEVFAPNIGTLDAILSEPYFTQFVDTIKSLVNIGYDYTILAHRAFVFALEDGIRRYHPFFEREPIESRHRYLGPLMVSPEEANTYADLLMRLIADLIEHPVNKRIFLLSYADAFVDYHLEYVSLKLFELNIHSSDSLAHFLANPSLNLKPDGKAYRPICELSPVLKRPELAHVVDYFDRAHSDYIANQHYSELFSAPFAPDLVSAF